MKIIVLGGAGDMASRAVRELAAEPDVSAVTVADYNIAAAERLAAELGDKVTATWVDANEYGTLVELIRGHDAAVSGIGPFYRYEALAAQAAIDARVPYVSLCDDYDGAQAALGLDEQAKAAGVTVLTGLGWTPGLSNVLARRAAEQLDQVDAINVAWGSSASDSEGYAVILHTMHIFTGDVPSFLYGRAVDVPAGSDRERVLFPPPVGEVNCYHVGHPEPVTLPRRYPGVQTVTLKGGLSEQPLNELARLLAKLRLTDTPAKLDVMGQIIKATLPLLSKLGQPENPCSAVRVDVRGKKDGAERQISYAAAAHMAELTALPLAVGALMLARGKVKQPGVVAPEDCIAPEPFLAELGRRGVQVVEMSGQWPAPATPPALRAGASEAVRPSPVKWVIGGMVALFILRRLLRRCCRE